ncbi:hypothetical protein [Ferrimonas futtsuensis]|uniref:hypothetical protein n=1 Tax=Ferrimonas futtsuensis TaxID=364764 RepID=UPI0004065667|nr:hypothetical protein [Ferrimonas futtsuensis]
MKKVIFIAALITGFYLLGNRPDERLSDAQLAGIEAEALVLMQTSDELPGMPITPIPKTMSELEPESVFVTDEGVYIELSSFWVTSEGVFVVRPGAESVIEEWVDPHFELIKGRVYRFSIAG